MASLYRSFGSSFKTKSKDPNENTNTYTHPSSPKQQTYMYSNTIKHELLLQIPNCIVHLVDENETTELGRGDFSIYVISDQNIPLATTIKVGDNLQWPLTKDEPVLKLDVLHYLFTLPMKEGYPLNYGVSFSDRIEKKLLGTLDAFLGEHCCFSCPSKFKGRSDLNWKDFAPKVEAYNGVLARAIANGTGHIVKGIFICSNAYTNQVQKGGELIVDRPIEEKKMKNNNIPITHTKSFTNNDNLSKSSHTNQSIKRVRKLSDTTEKMSKAMLNGVGIATGSVMGPLVNSNQGRALLSMMPAEVLLASLDALDKIICAAEAAEKQALGVTSDAATRMVTNRFGENAGEATEDVLATAGHCAGTAWNVLKIRRAINPAAAAKSGVLKTAAKSIKY
ncbi:hypothetical protein RND81_07G090800 [Saponaria officinalis]|uniref:Senescence domain-containing protein n=1 Tax=Saponaria officinalis TaxID=3572 RepID=A0AAW1JNE5_SAPOF